MFGVYLFFGMFVAVIAFILGYGLGFNWHNIVSLLNNPEDIDRPR